MWHETFQDLDAWQCTWEGQLVFATNIHMANASIREGGGLRITGNYEAGVTNESSLLDSTVTYHFGYFECRAKVPPGGGLWPAFWLYGVSNPPPKPEIDIFESIGDGYIYITTHLGGVSTNTYSKYTPLSDGYHTYACKWDAERTKFFLDGNELCEFTTGVPQTALNVMLDLYIGGTWPGNPPPEVTFPVYFDVDYVKVWQRV